MLDPKVIVPVVHNLFVGVLRVPVVVDHVRDPPVGRRTLSASADSIFSRSSAEMRLLSPASLRPASSQNRRRALGLRKLSSAMLAMKAMCRDLGPLSPL
jgi:hypothetical protein